MGDICSTHASDGKFLQYSIRICESKRPYKRTGRRGGGVTLNFNKRNECMNWIYAAHKRAHWLVPLNT